MFVDRLRDLPPVLADFRPCPPATDRASWLGLPDFVRELIARDGEKVAGKDYPALPATAYLDYTRSGDRARFEAAYFTRRRMLNAAVLAECAEHRGRFLDQIIDGVVLLCEESGWQLPAHNALVRGGRRMALPDVDNPVIDLFAAETGAQLAVIAAALQPELEAAAPGIVRRLDRELERRLFRPYLGRHFWWMGNDGERTNNWTSWCTQNVLLAAFCRPLDQTTRRDILIRAAASLERFVDAYGEDGACEEGVLYYRHAALCLFNAMVVLAAVAPDCFAPLWRETKIRNMAEYIVKMNVAGRSYFNFGDSSAILDRCGAREFLFGEAVGSRLLADFAAADWAEDKSATLPAEINLFYRMQSVFATPRLASYRPAQIEHRDTFLPNTGVFIARDAHFALAVKAGHNGESHNHNDVGSLILYKDAQPVLIDVGVETYTAKTFSLQRYDIWTMQSAYHNLPAFEGVMQRDGAAFAARNLEVSLGDDRPRISMDLAGAYPAEAELRSYKRRVVLAKGTGVEIEDEHDGDRSAVLSLMLSQEPLVEQGRITLPGLATIALDGAGAVQVESIPVTDARLRIAWPDRLYRALVPLAGSRLTLNIK
jgi:hypothetical protein